MLGEAAVAGMAAAELEQHAAWVDKGDAAARAPRGAAVLDPEADAEAIAALVLAVATVGRVPERRRPSRSPRPPARARARAAGPRHAP